MSWRSPVWDELTFVGPAHADSQPRADEAINDGPMYDIKRPLRIFAAVPLEQLPVWVIPAVRPQPETVVCIVPWLEATDVVCNMISSLQCTAWLNAPP